MASLSAALAAVKVGLPDSPSLAIYFWNEKKNTKEEIHTDFPKGLARILSAHMRMILDDFPDTTEITVKRGSKCAASHVLHWMLNTMNAEAPVPFWDPTQFAFLALMLASCEELKIEIFREQLMQSLESLALAGPIHPFTNASAYKTFAHPHDVKEMAIFNVAKAIFQDQLDDEGPRGYRVITWDTICPNFVKDVYYWLYEEESKIKSDLSATSTRSRDWAVSDRNERARTHYFSKHWLKECWPPVCMYRGHMNAYPPHPLDPEAHLAEDFGQSHQGVDNSAW